jgi:hypothetical protein
MLFRPQPPALFDSEVIMNIDWDDGKLVRVAAVAERLDYSPDTIRRMVKAKVLKGCGRRVTTTSVNAFLRQVEEGNSPWPVRMTHSAPGLRASKRATRRSKAQSQGCETKKASSASSQSSTRKGKKLKLKL